MKMQEIIRYTHLFLQKFCMGNQENQALLHKNLNLFLNPGVPGFFCSFNAGSNSHTIHIPPTGYQEHCSL